MLFYFENDENWKKAKEELLSWVGTPYKHMGRVKGRGVDCNMFIGQSLVNLGILTDLNYEYYPKDWWEHTDDQIILFYIEKHRKLLKEGFDFYQVNFPNEKLLRGDYLGFAVLNSKGIVNHSGILLDNNTFIHASIGKGVRIDELNDYWLKHLKIVFRLIYKQGV